MHHSDLCAGLEMLLEKWLLWLSRAFSELVSRKLNGVPSRMFEVLFNSMKCFLFFFFHIFPLPRWKTFFTLSLQPLDFSFTQLLTSVPVVPFESCVSATGSQAELCQSKWQLLQMDVGCPLQDRFKLCSCCFLVLFLSLLFSLLILLFAWTSEQQEGKVAGYSVLTSSLR